MLAKKKFVCLAVLSICCALFAVYGVSAAAAAPTMSFDKVMLSVTASTPGGTTYTLATGIDTIWETYLPGLKTRLSPGSTGQNLMSVILGEFDIGWTHCTMFPVAARGEKPYDKVYTGAKSLGTIHPAQVSFIVRRDSDIKSLADLYNKRVAFLAPGTTAYTPVLQLFEEEYGITPDSIVANGGTVNNMGQSEALAGLQDDQVDVYINLYPHPASNLVEMNTAFGIRLLSVEKEHMDNFLKNHTDWQSDVIPAGAYEGFDEEVLTLATYMILSCNEKMDEELVYNLTKTLWDNIGDLWEVSAEGKLHTRIENALKSMTIAPLHPGAERYYREAGVLK